MSQEINQEINQNIKIIKGNITSPIGFKTSGNAIGLKKNGNKDMAIILSDKPCKGAGVFTTNLVKAAPVYWDMNNINNDINAIVVNSGNANACTGEKGQEDTEAMAKEVATLINAKAENVLVCSTGVIGVNLPMDIVLKGIRSTYNNCGYTYEHGFAAATAIMTTDTIDKQIAVTINIGGKPVTIGAMAKGSGMINPNMATMLCFITTDCNISKELLDKALKDSVNDSFNMICVDGDMSTNDSVICIANGMAENDEINQEGDNYNLFKEALMYVNKSLAIACVDDGEGATKLIEATVKQACTKDDARKIALSVVSSSLFKAAIFGEDANWGRVLCAMGYSKGRFDPLAVSIIFRSELGNIMLMDRGKPINFDEEVASQVLKAHKINVDIYLNDGECEAVAWGCDLTYDYVKINGDYRS